MSYIEKLLQGAEVDWKPLGEVATLEKGKQLNKSLLTESGRYPAYNGGITYSGFTDRYNYSENKTIISQGGASAGFVNFITTKFYANAHCYVVLPNISRVDNKYVYHLLKMNQENLMSKQLGAGIPALHTTNILGISIPIPCPDNPTKSLEIQRKIVEILDKFTTLEAELEAELDCRKRQYEYYRNQLLSFDMLNRGGQRLNNVTIMSLGELGTFTRGGGLQKKDFTLSGVGCIHYGQIYTYYGTYAKRTKSYVSQEFAQKARKAKNGDLIIATTSENDEDVCKAVAWLGDEEIAVSSDACFYAHTMNPKYVAYYFQTEQFQKQKRCFITGTKVRRVNSNDLAKIKIPVPPLAEQERIASILDKFDTLTNSISEGLPKEIELRRKQYEYYRNQLLSFPEHKATA
ncbi:restriction endonuclease subunit S [Prevotella jejuni]|uniref:restriction endonuclease subunit S n=1 Tax=Prevotella jejuni TaxID=1177574 RepID=UPI001BA8A09C|nr:restriction endonuclease subunit S [Prevotella jejuni]QUB81884.1 restriction endonuclease subunit S [Prevotella jejuni]